MSRFIIVQSSQMSLCMWENNPAQVAVKVSRMVADPTNRLRDEAEMHAQAWTRLGHVLRPVGFLSAHEATDTPAALVTEIGV